MSNKNYTGCIKCNINATKLANELKKSEKQYPPLSKKQEREMIQQYKDNRDKLNKLLFLHNIRIVYNIAKKYVGKTDDFDNMIQNGLLGLIEAANRFDITKNIKFITYAHIWVKKYILAEFYGSKAELDKKSTSLNSPALTSNKINDNEETSLEDYINEYIDPSCSNFKTIDEELSSNDQIQICNNLMNYLEHDSSLSSTDKNVFVDIFYNKEKTSDIALKYQITNLDVHNIKHKILDKFKNILSFNYNINSYDDVR